MEKKMKLGDILMVRGKPMKIVRVWPLGTYDVTDGKRYYRVTGLYAAAK